METNNDVLEIILIIAVILIGGISYVRLNKSSKKPPTSNIIEGANLLMTALPRAIAEKTLEDPLLASTSHSQQANNRLHIAAIYLMVCLTAISRSNNKENYTNSQPFASLLSEVLPSLKQLYIERGTKAERIKELIDMNFKKIKALINNYSKELKLTNIDTSLAIQAWFEELSYINLANKPYLTDILLKLFNKDKEQDFIILLCQPKAYSLLVDQIRDNTESFIRLTHSVNNEALQQQAGQIISYTHFEQYISSFLLILGITILKQANGSTSYLQTSEYQAIKNKAISTVKAMLLNSRKVGVQSVDPNQTKQIMAFMNKQLASLQMACLSYMAALNNVHTETADPAIYLFEWFKQTLPSNANASIIVKDYIGTTLHS